MAKKADDNFIDGGLDEISTCTTLTVCSAEPANFAGIAALLLAAIAVTGPDFVKADGDTNGRKVRVLVQTDVSITNTGTATHVVLDDGVNIYVTTCTSQALTAAGTVTIPEWDVEIADPV